jgi:hypothetical protein
MTTYALMILATVVYTIIALRVAKVLVRARIAYGVEPDRPLSTVFGFMWPAAAVFVGLFIIISGDAGIYQVRRVARDSAR